MDEPIRRSPLRRKLGSAYYSLRRHALWWQLRHVLAWEQSPDPLPHVYAAHATPLLRQLKDVDMWMQYNKIVNLKLAVPRLDGLLLRPGEVLSYWRRIGPPTRAKGYVEGMLLRNGRSVAGVGGGLCQLSNLIFWLTLHTPLTVTERHRHGFDVFPDTDRTQPFGSGATCSYPSGDLTIRNDTTDTYQLCLKVGQTHLEGEWRVSAPPEWTFQVVERGHQFRQEAWGGYSRHNVLYQQRFDLSGVLLDEVAVVENSAVMMYPPFLPPAGET